MDKQDIIKSLNEDLAGELGARFESRLRRPTAYFIAAGVS
jgi:hypothetical protein